MRTTRTAVAAVAALVVGVALAHEGATGIVKDRMAMMQNMDLQLKAIQAMLSGWAPFDAVALRNYAAALHDSCHQSESLFPAGSQDRASHARPAVWDNPQAFREEFQKLHEASEALVETIAGGGRTDIAVAINDLRQTCDGCHATFRKVE
jgi:cytochrome c556